MALVAISALTGRAIDGHSAVTGEITVHGAVKAVGGVPEKIEAARQAGITRVIIPEENAAEVLHADGMTVLRVSTLAEAMSAMLLPEAAGSTEMPDFALPEGLCAAAAGRNP